MDARTLDYYERNAREVAARYDAAGEGIAAHFPFVFKPGQRVLEIGAGSGRDAVRLLALGVDVQAVEPSAALRASALAAHPELAGKLFGGSLPHGLPPELCDKYDGILFSAVIMHIRDAELFDTAFQLRERLVHNGRLLLSMSIERPDVQPGAERDHDGRLMIVRSVPRVRLLFERLGFDLESEWTSGDSSGRNVLWATLVFRASATSSRAIDRVESIVNADRKVATYKLALIRALCDIAMTASACAWWESDGTVSVPLVEVSKRWILYYWPLVDRETIIPQINAEDRGGKPLAFRTKLSNLARHFRPLGGMSAFVRMVADGNMAGEQAGLCQAALKAIGSAVVKGPVQFAGNARGEPEFRYDGASERIRVGADLWRELSLMGHWIRDAVVLRWAEMTSHLTGGELPPGAVLDLLLSEAEPFRMDPTVRAIYLVRCSELKCVWSGASLGPDLEVDHAIPFTFWRASPAWNLLPASRAVNNAKRDRLPTHALIQKRQDAIVANWRFVERELPARFRREAAELVGASPTGNWEGHLLAAFSEAVEYIASVRGAQRWEP